MAASRPLSDTAVESFSASLRGSLLPPGDVGYDDARATIDREFRAWDGRGDPWHQPDPMRFD